MLLNVILIKLSFFCSLIKVERALLIAVCLLTLIVELLNAIIEKIMDRTSLNCHTLSKKRSGYRQRRAINTTHHQPSCHWGAYLSLGQCLVALR